MRPVREHILVREQILVREHILVILMTISARQKGSRKSLEKNKKSVSRFSQDKEAAEKAGHTLLKVRALVYLLADIHYVEAF
jgi:hypothetical protein